MEHKTVIEINGVKLEVDLRTARRVDELRVGDRVKVLIKGYSEYTVHPGTVIGFEPFKNLPTIIIAYLVISYNSVELKFLHFNAGTKETEIVKAIDNDQLDIDKANVMQQFDRQIAAKEREADELRQRRDYFVKEFRSYWAGIEQPVSEE